MKILGIEYMEDTYEDMEKEFTQAEKKTRVVKTVSKESAYAETI